MRGVLVPNGHFFFFFFFIFFFLIIDHIRVSPVLPVIYIYDNILYRKLQNTLGQALNINT